MRWRQASGLDRYFASYVPLYNLVTVTLVRTTPTKNLLTCSDHLVRKMMKHEHPLLIWSSLFAQTSYIHLDHIGCMVPKCGINLVWLHQKDCQYHRPIQSYNCLGTCTGARAGVGKRLPRTEGVERAAPNRRRSPRWGALSNARSNAMRMARRSPRNHDLEHGAMAGTDDFALTQCIFG